MLNYVISVIAVYACLLCCTIVLYQYGVVVKGLDS